MRWPEKDSPFWPCITMMVFCGVQYLCLDKLYKHGFVLEKDGLTMALTVVSAIVTPLVNRIVNRSG